MSGEKFQSKKSFVLAAVGAAVGLGNALRFPGLCAKYGGGSFLLIYFIALVVLGVPLLNAEIALGRRYRSGAPVCLSRTISKFPRFGAGVGWAACFNSVLTAIIYSGLAGWIIATVINIIPLSVKAENMTQYEISGYFFAEVLHADNRGRMEGISLTVVLCIIAAWVLMFFCLKGGAKTLAKAAKFTVIIPIVLLLIMAGRGLLYENSAEALSALFIPDFSKLYKAELWVTALGQVFFSLSIVVGIMPAYGAYLPEKTNIFTCSLIIAAADFLVSVLAAVVLFTTLYGCGLQGAIGSSGIVTAFEVYPVAITRLFGNSSILNAAAGVLFYSSLAMMSVQSAVSMTEAFLFPFSEARKKPKKNYVYIICISGLLISLVFATTAAPSIVGVSDKIINFYNVLLLGVLESLILAFSKEIKGLNKEINRYTKKLKMPKTLFSVSIRFLCPVILVLMLICEFLRIVC